MQSMDLTTRSGFSAAGRKQIDMALEIDSPKPASDQRVLNYEEMETES